MAEVAETLTGGEAIVRALLANSVDTVFGLPGAQVYPLFDALGRAADRIRLVGARHEQTCGYMAFGYARSTGRPGVFAVVPGPGFLNATAALCTAAGCCAPVLCLTGQVPTPFIGRGRGHLHELADQLGTARTLVKWAARIEHPADAPALVDEAFRQMLTGRPGPVLLEMAWDVMAAREPVTVLPGAEIPPAPPPDPDAIGRAAALLAKAKRPMIMVGSGAQGAGPEVAALARRLGAPVAAFRGGRGVVPEDGPLGITSYEAHLLWPETDCLVGIGSRLEMPFMRWAGMMTLHDRPAAPPHLIRIDIDPAEMERLVPHAPIVADAREGTAALLAALPEQHAPASSAERIEAARTHARDAIAVVQPQLAFLQAIRAELPDDGFLVPELSQVGFTSYFGFPVRQPRTYVSEGFQGTLGFGFPTALGVKVANPGRAVVSVTGDGGLMFALGELATAAQEDIGLVTIVFDNGAYGNVLRDQRERFGNRIVGASLRNPDFAALAGLFGIEAHQVETPDGLRPVLRAALGAGRPVLIHVPVPQGSEASPWPFIHPAPRAPS